MAMNLDALLKITARVDGANNIDTLNRGLHSVEGTAKGVTTAMRGMTGAASGLSGALGALAPLLSVAGLVGLAKGALDAGDRMNDLAQSTGVSVESLAKFKKAAATSGTDIDRVANALVKLSKGMLEASTGNKQASASFKALGVSITDSKGKLKTSDEVMLQVANRFKAMPDGVAKTALALKLFGKSGAEMVPLLNMGGDAIEKLGSKMTTAFAQKADEYSDKLALLSMKVGALGQDLFLTLLPALTAVTDAVSGAVQGFNNLPGPIKALAAAGALLAIAWGPIAGLIKGAQVAFIVAAAAIGTFRVQIALAAMEGIPALNAAIMSVPVAGWAIAAAAAVVALGVAAYNLSPPFRAFIDEFPQRFERFAQELVQGFADTFATIAKGWGQFVGFVGNTLSPLQGAMKGTADFIRNAWRAAFGGIQIDWKKTVEFMLNATNPLYLALKGISGGKIDFAKATTNLLFNPAPGSKAPQKPPKPPAEFVPNFSALDTGAANKAAQLANNRRKQLTDADKLLATENSRLEISAAANELEKIQAEYDKTQVDRRVKFLALQKGALSDKAREVYAEAQYVAIQADRFEYNAKIQKLMQDQTKELYTQLGLARVLDKELQRSMGNAFNTPADTSTFRTDVDLMPGLTGGELGTKMEELKKSLEDLQNPIKQVMAGAQAIGEAFSTSFKGLIDGSMSAQEAMAGFFKSIANHFLDMASQMIAKYIEMQIIGLAQKFLPGMFGGIFGASGPPDYSGSTISVPNQYSYSANGNVFAQNGIVPYAMGGIVDRPTLFPFAKGIGLMGEAGPEAIMPLKRGADGKLDVAGGGGGGSTNVTVNVDASGNARVQGDQSQAKQLGVAVSAAVQAELVKQQRPGGLLAGTRR